MHRVINKPVVLIADLQFLIVEGIKTTIGDRVDFMDCVNTKNKLQKALQYLTELIGNNPLSELSNFNKEHGTLGIIIEATSNNTGIALAFVVASKGYKLILSMPETFRIERLNLLKALGAQLLLTPSSEDMGGAVEKAEELHIGTPNSFISKQFKNPANLLMHLRTSAKEIWKDTHGKVDAFISGVGINSII